MKTILVVDDEPDVRDSVKIILEKEGHKVLTAVDGDNCLNILHDVTPDLILLDIMMPGKPVSEIVEQINNIKIAFMSIVRLSTARKQGLCKHNNIVDYIQKPFDTEELKQRVAILLNP